MNRWKNTIHRGDCLEVMQHIPDRSIDSIICDLPYGTTACSWDNVIPFEPLWEQYNRIIKSNGAIVLFGSEPFSSHLRMSNIKNYKYDWVWNKIQAGNFMNIKTQPLKVHENIIIFCKNTIRTYNPIRVDRTVKSLKRVPKGIDRIIKRNNGSIAEHYGVKPIDGIVNIDGKRNPISIIEFSKAPKTNRYNQIKHPTKKPVALLEYLIKTYTNENETVLDNTAGSFTTAIACIKQKRNYIMIEKDKHYFEIGKKRIAEQMYLENQRIF